MTIRDGARVNIYGGTIYGKITNSGNNSNFVISGSSKIVYNDTASGLTANNLRINGISPTLKNLTADAKIGFFYEGDPAGTEIKVATLVDCDDVTMDQFGISVYFADKGDRTFGLKRVGNELFLYETTPVAP